MLTTTLETYPIYSHNKEVFKILLKNALFVLRQILFWNEKAVEKNAQRAFRKQNGKNVNTFRKLFY